MDIAKKYDQINILSVGAVFAEMIYELFARIVNDGEIVITINVSKQKLLRITETNVGVAEKRN